MYGDTHAQAVLRPAPRGQFSGGVNTVQATGTVLMAALRCAGPGRAGLDSSGGAGRTAEGQQPPS